jgi:hypothetical protein
VTSNEKGLAIEGEFLGLDLTVGGKRRVRRVKGQFSKKPRKQLEVHDITGEAYGGRLEGRAVALLKKPMKYRLRVTFEALRLEELLNGGNDAKGKGAEVLGLVDGSMEMSGEAGNVAARRASGQLRISKARLVKLPVLLSILHVVSLSLPGEGPFVRGFIEYDMKGSTVVFREIHLRGAAASLVGSGKMDIGSRKLNLTFLSGPGPLPRLGSIEELLRGILRELAEVRITGTLEEPEVKTVPLRSLKALIDTITSPER